MAETVLDRLTAGSMFDLRGVVAVVTGGGSGIGLMIASTLVANGATVYIVGLVQEELDRIAKTYNDAAEKNGRPGRMHGVEGDVSRKSEAIRLAQEIGKREKHITVLFNNAGIATGRVNPPTTASVTDFVKAYLDEVPENSFNETITTNAVGPYWLTFAFLPLLAAWKEYTGGSRSFAPQVIMTSSINGWSKDPATASWSFPYMYSKAALINATAALAHELLPLEIRVNGIAPGSWYFMTELTAPGSINEIGQSYVAAPGFGIRIPCTSPSSVPGTPPQAAGSDRDMGATVLFLVGNWFVNGETVALDGGSLLVHPSSH